METKICSKCGKRKNLIEFYIITRHGKPYIIAQCKSCVYLRNKEYHKKNPHINKKAVEKWRKKNPQNCRARSIKFQYGITLQEYSQLLVQQQARCAICGTTNPSPFPNFCIDHNHTTNEIRGLLCNRCNSAIGFLNDDPEICRKAADYLEK